MAGVLAQIQKEQDREQTDSLAIARSRANWSETFNKPDAAQAKENLADLAALAIERKQQLQAQTSLKAGYEYAQMQEVKARTKHANEMAPLNVQLRQQQFEREKALTAATGSHDRFLIQKDQQAANDSTGFFQTVGQIKAPVGTPQYQSELNIAVQKFPRVIGTQAGAAAVKQLFDEHQDVLAMKPPPGMAVDSYTADENGKLRAVFKPIEAAKPELVTVTETTESKDTPADINLPETTTRRTITSKQPAAKVKQTTPATGKSFLEKLGIKPKPPKIKSTDGTWEG